MNYLTYVLIPSVCGFILALALTIWSVICCVRCCEKRAQRRHGQELATIIKDPVHRRKKKICCCSYTVRSKANVGAAQEVIEGKACA